MREDSLPLLPRALRTKNMDTIHAVSASDPVLMHLRELSVLLYYLDG
jgi:hypothetical protein